MEGVQESHSALQIALKTMRERCQYLQQRLNSVEEENYKLKLKLTKDIRNRDNSGTFNTSTEDPLQDQISLLMKQKAQLSHHIHMVANENRTLWTRLSKLTLANHSLGNHLNKISDTLNKHDTGLSESKLKEIEGIQSSNRCENSFHGSLEEISLKLINGILLEKTELESQYAQMVDLQNDTEKSLDIQNLGFSFPDEEDSSVLSDINLHYEKLKKFKVLLDQEKNNLQSILRTLQNSKDKNTCLKCKNNTLSTFRDREMCEVEEEVPTVDNRSNEGTFLNNNQNVNNTSVHYTRSSTIQLTEEANDTSEDIQQHDKICPMCGITFCGDYEEFYSHVTNHFSDEEIPDFELVPQET